MAKIRALMNKGVSCVLVIGGSGDYFEVADCVIAMDSFRAVDMSQQAHQITEQFGYSYKASYLAEFGSVTARTPTSIYTGA